MPSRPNGQIVAAAASLRWSRGATAPTPHSENTPTFAARKAANACFGCDVHGELVPNQPHWEGKYQRGGFGVLPGAAGPRFCRRGEPPAGWCPALPAREGAGPGPVSPLHLHHIRVQKINKNK